MPIAVVTGAAGFVGSHIAACLLGEGWTVRGVDSFDPAYGRTHKERALGRLTGNARFTLTEGDVRDRAAMGRALAGATALVHAAARAGVRDSVGAPARAARANVATTVAVLAAARAAGVRRLVHLSSSSVYGNGPLPFDEAQGWLRPVSPYAASKRAAELLVAGAARRGMRVASLRLFSVYGPGQRPDQAAWRFAARLASGAGADQYGDGSARRDFTFVDDVADAVVRAVAWTAAAGPGLLCANIGAGTPVRVDRFRALLAAALGVPDRAVTRPVAAGDVAGTAAVTDRAFAALGWRAATPLAEGLAAFADWFEVINGRPTGTTARSGA